MAIVTHNTHVSKGRRKEKKMENTTDKIRSVNVRPMRIVVYVLVPVSRGEDWKCQGDEVTCLGIYY